jgi:hypothetical protein
VTKRTILIAGARALAVLALIVVGLAIGVTDRDDNEGDEPLLKALSDATVTLQQGLAASEQEGQPISGQFEFGDNKFQLSVYIAKDDKFSELLVNLKSGKITKVAPVTNASDITAAHLQKSAMKTAKLPLKHAVDKAASSANGFQAVSVAPDLKDGHAWASVVLVLGEQSRTILVPLE